ncbi:MAG: permease [Clostridiales bacterium]|nr:permease [Clostridiales bacterium]
MQTIFDIINTPLICVFLIAVIGYLIGGIKIKGIEIGTAGVLLVALVFGHFQFEVPDFVNDLGIALFVTSVGFIAGPKFFRNFVKNAKSYVLLGLLIIASGAAVCAAVVLISGGKISPPLAAGLLTGALTSTPGLAAAKEAAGELGSQAATGYGIAYPFGVIGVVLFVQLIPKILKVNMDEERKRFEATNAVKEKKYKGKLFAFDPFGLMPLAAAITLGVLLGKITIPLPGGAHFALGTSGGPLITGLIFGHFGHAGKIDITVKPEVLKTTREFGLVLFLIAAGIKGGQSFVSVLMEQGVMLFVYGAIMTLIPMLTGYIFARHVLKLNLFNSLGSICGGMTSTPALGTLIGVTGTDDVASAYAATYPVALVFIVLASQFIIVLM